MTMTCLTVTAALLVLGQAGDPMPPTMVKLDYEASTVADVVKAIDAAGPNRIAIDLAPMGRFAGRAVGPAERPADPRKFQFREAKSVSFWSAVDQICRAGQLMPELQSTPNRRIALRPASPDRAFVSIDGSFHASIKSVAYSRGRRVHPFLHQGPRPGGQGGKRASDRRALCRSGRRSSRASVGNRGSCGTEGSRGRGRPGRVAHPSPTWHSNLPSHRRRKTPKRLATCSCRSGSDTPMIPVRSSRGSNWLRSSRCVPQARATPTRPTFISSSPTFPCRDRIYLSARHRYFGARADGRRSPNNAQPRSSWTTTLSCQAVKRKSGVSPNATSLRWVGSFSCSVTDFDARSNMIKKPSLWPPTARS